MKVVKIHGVVINCNYVAYVSTFLTDVKVCFSGNEILYLKCNTSEEAEKIRDFIYDEMISE